MFFTYRTHYKHTIETQTGKNSEIMNQALFENKQTYLNHFHSVYKALNSSISQSH
jgi:hypothetical protein